MTSVEEMLNEWKKGLSIETENDEEISHNENGFDMLYMSLTPRIKWFKPPLWKIFRWAYKIDKAYLLKNCIHTNPVPTDKTELHELHIEFSCNKVDNPEVEKTAEYLRNQWEEYMKKQDKEK